MPRRRSISCLASSFASADINISATQVLLQSNFLPGSRNSSASRTACKFAPQDLQNFTSSLWVDEQRGQIMGSSYSGGCWRYVNSTSLVLVTKGPKDSREFRMLTDAWFVILF